METEYEKVQHMLLLTDQMRQVQADPMLSFPRGEIRDMREAVARIRIEGLFLDEAELDDLRKTLSYAVEVEQFFGSLDELKYPLLKALGGIGAFGNLGNIVREIDRILDRYGELGDKQPAGQRRTHVGCYPKASQDGRFGRFGRYADPP